MCFSLMFTVAVEEAVYVTNTQTIHLVKRTGTVQEIYFSLGKKYISN